MGAVLLVFKPAIALGQAEPQAAGGSCVTGQFFQQVDDCFLVGIQAVLAGLQGFVVGQELSRSWSWFSRMASRRAMVCSCRWAEASKVANLSSNGCCMGCCPSGGVPGCLPGQCIRVRGLAGSLVSSDLAMALDNESFWLRFLVQNPDHLP